MSFTLEASTQRPHDGDVTAVFATTDQVFSGGEDGLVKVWDTKLNQAGEIKVSTYSIYDMTYKNDSLYTCNYDGKISIWSRSGEKEWASKKVLEGHLESVRRIRFADNVMYSGDETGVVIEWIDDEKKRVFNILEEIWDLWVVNDFLFTVRDKDVVISNIKGKTNFSNRGTLEGRGPMHLMDGKLYCITRDGLGVTAYGTNADNFPNLGTMKGHEKIINALTGRNNMLFSSGWDGQIKAWDVRTLQIVATYDAKENINCLSVNENNVVYAGGSNGVFVGVKFN